VRGAAWLLFQPLSILPLFPAALFYLLAAPQWILVKGRHLAVKILNRIYLNRFFRWTAGLAFVLAPLAMKLGWIPMMSWVLPLAPAALVLVIGAPFFSWLFGELGEKVWENLNQDFLYLLTRSSGILARSPRYLHAREEYRAWQDGTLSLHSTDNLPPKIRIARIVDAANTYYPVYQQYEKPLEELERQMDEITERLADPALDRKERARLKSEKEELLQS